MDIVNSFMHAHGLDVILAFYVAVACAIGWHEYWSA